MYYSALIGKPTAHSVSDIMFEYLARAAGISERYTHLKCDIEEQRLGEALRAFQSLGFTGVNVTLPYKIAIMAHLDEIDETAQALGAVNTITCADRLIGYNTDWIGIAAPLNERLHGMAITQATILGSGGAARAAIYACQQIGVQHTTVLYRNEPSQKTLDLKSKQEILGVTLQDYSHLEAALESAQLIMNATTAGMVGEAPLPFDLDRIAHVSLNGKVYFDVVANPPETPLAAYFKRRGAQTIDGLWMMLYQGVAALSLWLGQELKIEQANLTKIYRVLHEGGDKNV